MRPALTFFIQSPIDVVFGAMARVIGTWPAKPVMLLKFVWMYRDDQAHTEPPVAGRLSGILNTSCRFGDRR